MRVLAFLDGTLGDPAQPYVRVDNTGVLRGDGVFETVLVVDGKPRELGPHLDRLARSAALLDLPEPDLEAWERAVQTVIDNWRGPSEIAVKLVYTRGAEGDPDVEPLCYALGMEIDVRSNVPAPRGSRPSRSTAASDRTSPNAPPGCSWGPRRCRTR